MECVLSLFVCDYNCHFLTILHDETISQYMVKKRGMVKKEVNKMIGITDAFDCELFSSMLYFFFFF